MPLAIATMGWLASSGHQAGESSSFARALASISVDFIDWQDFTLTLIDDEVLKTYWGKGENGYGGTWLWKVLLAFCVVSFGAMTAELIYNFTCGLQQGLVEDGETNKELEQDWLSGKTQLVKKFTQGDYITTAVSLLFIEIPFLFWRVYV